jgi:hypothetical protein
VSRGADRNASGSVDRGCVLAAVKPDAVNTDAASGLRSTAGVDDGNVLGSTTLSILNG